MADLHGEQARPAHNVYKSQSVFPVIAETKDESCYIGRGTI